MKVSIIGLGKVGSSLAFILSLKSVVRELVLVGRTKESVMGDVLDLTHGQLFVKAPTNIVAGTIEDTKQSDIIAICASVPTPKTMQNRMELATENVKLIKTLVPQLARLSPQAKLLVVSNPVDVLVHFAIEFSGFDSCRVMGTGTLVDSARFRQLISDEIQIHVEDIRAYILGEHGNSQFPAMSCAVAGGEQIDATPERYAMAKQAAEAGLEVFKYKGYTNYTIALAAADIIQCIIEDTKHTMPVSLQVDGFAGINDVCLSLPAVVGWRGIERILHPHLNIEETSLLKNSALAIRKVIDEVGLELAKKTQLNR